MVVGQHDGGRSLQEVAVAVSVETALAQKNRALEVLELRARLDSELGGEHLVRAKIGGERIRLPAVLIKREHQLLPERLAQGVLCCQNLEFGHEFGVTTEGEVRLDPSLERAEVQLLKPKHFRLERCFEGKLHEWKASPERQCFP